MSTDPFDPAQDRPRRARRRRGVWLANGKRAYRVVREHQDGAVTLRDGFGGEFTTTAAHIEQGGYAPVGHKPRYAEQDDPFDGLRTGFSRRNV